MRFSDTQLSKAGIPRERVQLHNDEPVRQRRFVLYWMQASQRAENNHALEYAILCANEIRKPLVVLFVLTNRYPDANLRHYMFLLEGLRETAQSLRKRGICLILRKGDPTKLVPQMARGACLLVMDRGYTRIQRKWREEIAGAADCETIQVESEVIVPVEWASDKEEYAARTLRPKIHKQLDRFLVPLKKGKSKKDSLDLRIASLDPADPANIWKNFRIDRSVPLSAQFCGGLNAARKRLRIFLAKHLDDYETASNDPSLEVTSRLSPYLHFGQISPLEIALAVKKKGGSGAEAFLEQLIVRRELAINFVFYNARYDQYDCLPTWARATLQKHVRDKREYCYTSEELEAARTHDPYWNAAQNEMRRTGHMHNYMRMYWGKKVIEWTPNPTDAFRLLLHLNNQYELDGREPNGYAGVAWCFGKHDRPWTQRKIFGTIRYMNAAGLERKFNINAYVHRINALADVP